MVALGVDIGGTNARAALVERSTGKLLSTVKEPLSDRTPAGVVSVVRSLVEKVGAGHTVEKVGVGVAGMLRGDIVVNAPNLHWRDVDFGGPLAKALGRQVRLVNDLSAAAWGEFRGGAARGVEDSFTVFVGTGVGSAIISGGRLVQGATGVAAEFGHVKLVPDGGRLCGCGEYGCLEAYMGGAKLTEWMAESGVTGTPSDLERQAQEGVTTAKGIYDFAVGHLALSVANQVTVLNPAVVVLGGGVLSRCPGMVRRINDVVLSRASAASRSSLQIRMAELGDDSGLVGAALLA
ncbi:MAG: ROK family protein [Archangiaceae bacterium]|nr:ROK family protein [Archangiaceae bacterium]